MGKAKKTNAMRILESEKISYEAIEYEVDEDAIDGISVATKLGQDLPKVFKTLVTVATSKDHYVFVIPVAAKLDLKKAAQAAGEKKVEMVHVKDLQGLTGYIRGGCSPIGMKKQFTTFVDASAKSIDKIMVSGGKKGFQVKLNVDDLLKAAKAQLADITMEED